MKFSRMDSWFLMWKLSEKQNCLKSFINKLCKKYFNLIYCQFSQCNDLKWLDNRRNLPTFQIKARVGHSSRPRPELGAKLKQLVDAKVELARRVVAAVTRWPVISHFNWCYSLSFLFLLLFRPLLEVKKAKLRVLSNLGR